MAVDAGGQGDDANPSIDNSSASSPVQREPNQDSGADAGTDACLDQKAADKETGDQAADHEEQGMLDLLGFHVRIPQSRDLMCAPRTSGNPPVAQTITDLDWICTFHHGGTEGNIYVRSTPTSCSFAYGYDVYPFYALSGQLSVNGVLEPVQDASYDSGGDHHNDSLSFTYKGVRYTYYHSSFGWGWRKCQPMDCLKLKDPSSGPVTEDGCTTARTLPEICVEIKRDGTHDPLIDTFAWCDGDPNHEA